MEQDVEGITSEVLSINPLRTLRFGRIGVFGKILAESTVPSLNLFR